ncbi:phosphopantetheine-binding protein [Acuticoccus mangrovi]|uniref:Carrier domain-containing protein n=1 Tax=Acuticoccus mangrovi TaxID=2796142 RepID=A0A934IV85_9HYPH|nr:phosphopantetheine-binding protein [Acuticoccus mangrovi]MBJ3778762.1 hypothetical protein [Acuticoccus mangrovi]
MTSPTPIAPTTDALREALAPFLDDVPEDDDNLMDFGLTSIAAMQLVGEWRAAGHAVSFVDLAKNPTIAGICALFTERSRSHG